MGDSSDGEERTTPNAAASGGDAGSANGEDADDADKDEGAIADDDQARQQAVAEEEKRAQEAEAAAQAAAHEREAAAAAQAAAVAAEAQRQAKLRAEAEAIAEAERQAQLKKQQEAFAAAQLEKARAQAAAASAAAASAAAAAAAAAAPPPVAPAGRAVSQGSGSNVKLNVATPEALAAQAAALAASIAAPQAAPTAAVAQAQRAIAPGATAAASQAKQQKAREIEAKNRDMQEKARIAQAKLAASRGTSGMSAHDAGGAGGAGGSGTRSSVASQHAAAAAVRAAAAAAASSSTNRIPTSGGVAELLEQKKTLLVKKRRLHRGLTHRAPRAPEPQRPKSQWDFLMEEGLWMATDVLKEREWKMHVAAVLAHACAARVRAIRAQQRAADAGAQVSAARDAADEGTPGSRRTRKRRRGSIASPDDPNLLPSASGDGSSPPDEAVRHSRALAAMVREFWAAARSAARSGPERPFLRPWPSNRSADSGAAAQVRLRSGPVVQKDVLGFSVARTVARARSVLAHMFGGARTDMADAPDFLPARLRDAGGSILSLLPPPAATHLRMYQAVALRWLDAQHTCSLNAILADDRGLGKRIVCVSAILHRVLEARAKVIAAATESKDDSPKHSTGSGAGIVATTPTAEASAPSAPPPSAAADSSMGAGSGKSAGGSGKTGGKLAKTTDGGDEAAGDVGVPGMFSSTVVNEARRTAHLAPVGPSLVVCPPSLLLHWEMELRRWCPLLRPHILVEGSLACWDGDGDSKRPALCALDVIIVPPSLVRNGGIAEACELYTWNIVVADATLNPFLPPSQPASSGCAVHKGLSPGVRAGTAMPFLELAYVADAGQRIVLFNRQPFSRLTLSGPLAQFLLPTGFDSEQTVCQYCVDNVEVPEGAEKPPPPSGPLTYTSEEIEPLPLLAAMKPFSFRRQISDRDMAAQLPTRRVRAVLCNMPPVQLRAVESAVDAKEMEKAVASTTDAQGGDLMPLVRSLAKLHALAQTSRVDGSTGELRDPAPAPLWCEPLQVSVFDKAFNIADPFRGCAFHGACPGIADVERFRPDLLQSLRHSELVPTDDGAKSSSKVAAFPYQHNAIRCSTVPVYGASLLELLELVVHAAIIPSYVDELGYDDCDAKGNSGLSMLLGHTRAPVALGGRASPGRLWSAKRVIIQLTTIPSAERVLAPSPILPATSVIDGRGWTPVTVRAASRRFEWDDLRSLAERSVGYKRLSAIDAVETAREAQVSYLRLSRHASLLRPSLRSVLVRSGKLAALLHLVDDARKCGNRLLILTSLPGIADDVCEFLSKLHTTYLRLDRAIDHGAAPPQGFGVLCAGTVDRFNRDPRITVGVACIVGVEDAGKLAEGIAPLSLDEEDCVSVGVGLGGPVVLGADTIVLFDVEMDSGAASQRRFVVERVRSARETKLVQLVTRLSIEHALYAASAPAGDVHQMGNRSRSQPVSRFRDTSGLNTDLLRRADLIALAKGQYTNAADASRAAATATTPALRAAIHKCSVESKAKSFLWTSAAELDEFREVEAAASATMTPDLVEVVSKSAGDSSPTSVSQAPKPISRFARRSVSTDKFGALYPAVARDGHAVAGVAGAATWVRKKPLPAPGIGLNPRHLHAVYQASGERARYTTRAYVPFDHLGMAVRRQIAWHQDELVLHYSHVYGPPHPDEYRVNAPPAVPDEPAVASARRMILADTEPVLTSHIAPTRADHPTSNAELEQEAEEVLGVPPDGTRKMVLPLVDAIERSVNAQHGRRAEYAKHRKAELEEVRARRLEHARKNQAAAQAAASAAAAAAAEKARGASGKASGKSAGSGEDGESSKKARQGSSSGGSGTTGLYAWDPWTPAEESLLMAAVHKFGTNWDLVREVMSAQPLRRGQSHHRSSRQCFDRHRKLLAAARQHSRSIEPPAPPDSAAAAGLSSSRAGEERAHVGQGHNSQPPAVDAPAWSCQTWQLRVAPEEFPVAAPAGRHGSSTDKSSGGGAAGGASDGERPAKRAALIAGVSGVALGAAANARTEQGMALAMQHSVDDAVRHVETAMQVKQALPAAFGVGNPASIARPHASHATAVSTASASVSGAAERLKAPSQVADSASGGQGRQQTDTAANPRRVEPFRKSAPYKLQAQQARQQQEARKKAQAGGAGAAGGGDSGRSASGKKDAKARAAASRAAAERSRPGSRQSRRQAGKSAAAAEAAAAAAAGGGTTQAAVAPAAPAAAGSAISQSALRAQVQSMMEAAGRGNGAATGAAPGTFGAAGATLTPSSAAVAAVAAAAGGATAAAGAPAGGVPNAQAQWLRVIAEIPQVKEQIQSILARTDLDNNQKINLIASLLKQTETAKNKEG